MSLIEVRIEDQVLDFLRRLPPEPRHRLRQGMRDLSAERGDTKALEGALDGYHRLRVGSYRVVFIYSVERGRRVILCLFAERRSSIYDLFIEMVSSRLREKRGADPEGEKPLPKAQPKPYRIPKGIPKAKPDGSKAGTVSPPRPARTKTAPRSPGK